MKCQLSGLIGRAVILIALTVGFARPGVTLAGEQGPDARALGIKESILSYCTHVDPTSAAKIKGQVSRLLQGSSALAVAALRKSADYRAGYADVSDFVGKVEKQNATKPCLAAAAAPRAASP
jgi:hypothetical protein